MTGVFVFARYVVLACLHAFLRNLPVVWSVFLLVRTCVPTRSSELLCGENAGPLDVLMSTRFLLIVFPLHGSCRIRLMIHQLWKLKSTREVGVLNSCFSSLSLGLRYRSVRNASGEDMSAYRPSSRERHHAWKEWIFSRTLRVLRVGFNR